MSNRLIDHPFLRTARTQRGLWDRFDHLVTADSWTTTLTDSGSAAITTVGLTISPSDGTVADNDEAYVASTSALFKFEEGKPIYIETLALFSEPNTNTANYMFGLMETVAANSLQDNGGGPEADYDGCVIHKVDGGTVWLCESSLGTSQTTTTSRHTVHDATNYQRLGIEVDPFSSTQCRISYFLDGLPMEDANRIPITHTMTYTGGAAMQLVLGAKNGSAHQCAIVTRYLGGEQLF